MIQRKGSVMKARAAILLLLLTTPAHADPPNMTTHDMLATIWELGENVQEDGHVVHFEFAEVPVILVYDERADRMRLISPILPVNELRDGQLEAAMQANFHSTLDARYAVSQGVVWSAFIHPLSDLTDKLLRSAIRQVVTAKVTFGDTYSSGQLVFPGGDNDP